MYGVAKALDILQGEQYMYMGVLQPTLHSLLRYQGSLSQMQYCTPLSNALEAGVKKRFSEVLEDKDLALAAAVHPKFKLSWIMENERKAATVRLLEEECRALEEHCSEDATGKEDGDEDDFFFHLPQALPSSTEVQQWAIVSVVNRIKKFKPASVGDFDPDVPKSVYWEAVGACAGNDFDVAIPCSGWQVQEKKTEDRTSAVSLGEHARLVEKLRSAKQRVLNLEQEPQIERTLSRSSCWHY
ncbi:zinc finger BED domain-containing protein 4-like [Ixodes scapularis]